MAVLGGEAAITGLGRPGGKGSPGVVPTLVGVGGTLAVRGAVLPPACCALRADPLPPGPYPERWLPLPGQRGQRGPTDSSLFTLSTPSLPQAVALLQQDGAAGQAGAAAGLATGAAMLKYMFDRFQACEYNAQEWPGDKAWPAVMGLLSFFILSAFWQVLLASLK